MPLYFAEYVLPGHPDKVCDRIADAIVDAAVQADAGAFVGVEVAIHAETVFVSGRLGASPEVLARIDEAAIARRVLAESGYGARFAPDPESLDVRSVLCRDDLCEDERRIRSLSDDQAIVIGYACADQRTGSIPVEQHVARTIARALEEVRRERADLLGPDGKVLVALEADAAGASRVADRHDAARLRAVSLSVHHDGGADLIEVQRAARAALRRALVRLEPALPRLCTDLAAVEIVVNGAGPFAVGGPMGDNGLSGKKLVMDGYGPRVPIGGGALSGKDPHKVDRLGALLARRLAVAIVTAGFADEVTVQLAYTPGCEAPLRVELGGAVSDRAHELLASYDLSNAHTFAALGLGQLPFEPLAAWGHFGADPCLSWERPYEPAGPSSRPNGFLPTCPARTPIGPGARDRTAR